MPDSIGGRAPFSSGSSREVRSEDDAGARSLPGDLRGQGSLQVSPDGPQIVPSVYGKRSQTRCGCRIMRYAQCCARLQFVCPMLCVSIVLYTVMHCRSLTVRLRPVLSSALPASKQRRVGAVDRGTSSTEPLAPIGNLVYVPERENASHATTSSTPFHSFPNRAVSSRGSKTYIDRIVMHHQISR